MAVFKIWVLEIQASKLMSGCRLRVVGLSRCIVVLLSGYRAVVWVGGGGLSRLSRCPVVLLSRLSGCRLRVVTLYCCRGSTSSPTEAVRKSLQGKFGESLISGTILKENISIVDEVVIGAGSLVLKSIDIKGTYFGHPIK